MKNNNNNNKNNYHKTGKNRKREIDKSIREKKEKN